MIGPSTAAVATRPIAVARITSPISAPPAGGAASARNESPAAVASAIELATLPRTLSRCYEGLPTEGGADQLLELVSDPLQRGDAALDAAAIARSGTRRRSALVS